MAKRRRRQDDAGPVSDINVTSLVDVTLTLLIIFIMVAPMIEQGIDVNLPSAEPKAINVSEILTISVAANGRIYFENQRVTLTELRARLGAIHAAKEDVPILIKADTDLKYGTVVEVLDAVRAVGISRLAMATRPPG